MLLGVSWAGRGLLAAQSPLLLICKTPPSNYFFIFLFFYIFIFFFVVHAEGIKAKETQDSLCTGIGRGREGLIYSVGHSLRIYQFNGTERTYQVIIRSTKLGWGAGRGPMNF